MSEAISVHNFRPGGTQEEIRIVSFPVISKSRSRLRIQIGIFFSRIWSAITFSEQNDDGLCEWLKDENHRLRQKLANSEAAREASEAGRRAAEDSQKILAIAYVGLNDKLTAEAAVWARQSLPRDN